MSTQQVVPELSVSVSNVGGIETTDRQLPPGVTVLSGENATNRSSFLRALATGLGADVATLKGDAPEGTITVEIGEETYTRTLRRQGRETIYEGDPYLTETDAIRKAELFAFLFSENSIRRFVRDSGEGVELRDLLMEPVDTDAIETRIDDLLREKRQLEDERDAAEKATQNLSALQREREALDDELDSLAEEIETLEAEIATFERSLESAEEESSELEQARQELTELRQSRTTLERKLSRKRDAREEVESELEALTAPEGDIDSLEQRRASLEDERSRLDDQIARIQSEIKEPLVEIRGVISELQAESSELKDALEYLPTEELGLSEGPLAALSDSGGPTDQLVEADSQVCLACGSQVPAERFETLDTQYGEMVSGVNTVLNEKRQKRRSIETELEEVRNELSEIESHEQKKEELERRRASLETDIDSLSEELAEVSDAIEDQQTTVQELGREENDELIERHEALARARTKREEKQNEHEEIEEAIEATREKHAEIESIGTEIESIEAEISELRSRVGELERSLKREFNEHIGEVLEILEFENIEEIAIRDQKETVREGRRTVEKTVFDLEVTRAGEDGTYQGRLEQLSESETELLGVIIALSGYLVHDVGEVCPVMLLDSVDALDAGRLRGLFEYMSRYQEYLVAALHPEDVAMFSTEQSDFRVIEW
jgi:DNA repair exonuclease SbcCD ATPase subunit